MALTQLVLAQVRFLDEGVQENTTLYAGLASMLLSSQAEKEPYTILEYIDSQVKRSPRREPGPGDRVAYMASMDCDLLVGKEQIFTDTWSHVSRFSIIFLAVLQANPDYFMWKVKHDTKALDSPLDRALIACAILESKTAVACWADTRSEYFYSGLRARVRFIALSLLWGVVDTGTPANLTIWERFQVTEILGWCVDPYRHEANQLDKIIKLFLQFGATTDMIAVVRGEAHVEEVTFHFKCTEVTLRPWKPHSFKRERRESHTIRRQIMGSEGDVHLSLRDWIKILDPENKERLLDMLDSREEEEKRLGSPSHSEPRSEHKEGEPDSREQFPGEKEDTAEMDLVPAPTTGPFGDVDLGRKVVLGICLYGALPKLLTNAVTSRTGDFLCFVLGLGEAWRLEGMMVMGRRLGLLFFWDIVSLARTEFSLFLKMEGRHGHVVLL